MTYFQYKYIHNPWSVQSFEQNRLKSKDSVTIAISFVINCRSNNTVKQRFSHYYILILILILLKCVSVNEWWNWNWKERTTNVNCSVNTQARIVFKATLKIREKKKLLTSQNHRSQTIKPMSDYPLIYHLFCININIPQMI